MDTWNLKNKMKPKKPFVACIELDNAHKLSPIKLENIKGLIDYYKRMGDLILQASISILTIRFFVLALIGGFLVNFIISAFFSPAFKFEIMLKLGIIFALIILVVIIAFAIKIFDRQILQKKQFENKFEEIEELLKKEGVRITKEDIK